MSYARGLGQAGDLVTLAAHSAEIIGLQTALMYQVPGMGLSRPDGVISATSPTLNAIRQWATSNGRSATGTARTSSSGLVISRALMEAITHSTPGRPTTTGTPTTGGKAPAAPSAALPDVSLVSGTTPAWAPWAVGATVLAALAGGYVLTRRR